MERYIEMGKTYGPMFKFHVFGQNIVVLNSHETLREAFVKNAEIFSGRAKNILTDAFFQGKGRLLYFSFRIIFNY